MRFYPYHIGDFNNATRYASRLERSVYRDLLDMYYEQESAIDGTDLDKLQRRLNVRSTDEQTALDFVLTEYFENQDGFYFNNRCEQEIKKYQDKLENAIKAGKASAEARRKKSTKKQRKGVDSNGVQGNSTDVQRTFNDGSTNVQPTKNQEPVTSNQEPVTNSIAFDDFWNAYDYKKGGVTKPKAKWDSLSDTDKELIMAHIPDYVVSTPVKKFRKHPMTYLNNEGWLDEIDQPQQAITIGHGNHEQSNYENHKQSLTEQLQQQFAAEEAEQGSYDFNCRDVYPMDG